MAKKMSPAAAAALEAIQENETRKPGKTQSEIMSELNEAACAKEKEAPKYINEQKREKAIRERKEVKDNLQSYMLESWLGKVFHESLGNRLSVISEDTKALNKSLIKGFIQEEGADLLIKEMETKTNMLATVARYISEEVQNQLDKYDEEKEIDSEEDIQNNLFEKLDGSEEFDDVSDMIHQRVSQATQDFIQKNMVDKLNIKDIMNDTKEKIDNIRTGDQEVDEEIKQEHTVRMKREIRNVSKRPHSIYEQLVINLTEAVLKNDNTKKKFTTEAGRLNMDAIVERATSFYTLIEMVNTLHLKDMTNEYIQDMISMK